MPTSIYRRFLLIIILMGLLSTSVSAHDDVWPGEKLQQLVPDAVSFEQHNLYLSQTQIQNIQAQIKAQLPKEDLEPSIYMAVTREDESAPPQRTAAIVFIDADVSGGIIEIGVVVDRSGTLLETVVFGHGEGGIPVPADILEDLKGLKAGQPLPAFEKKRLGEEAFQTYLAARSGVHRGLVLINEIFGH